ncbi:MAG: hypothetical protein ACRCUI_14885 [Polymorphobacter sp.]
MHLRSLFALALVAPLVPAVAAEQTVVPPKARYWMSATTASGMSMGAAGNAGGMGQADMMKMAMGGGGAHKLLDLDLGSTLAPGGGGPKADALIPPGMNMGPRLPLTTPVAQPAARTPDREDDDFERPKGKLLLFWGCSEKARPGQPVVIDFAAMAAGQVPANLFGGERIRIARPPSSGNSRTFGAWPLGDPSQRSIPANASLIGNQRVEGNYSPPISFELTQDWLAALTLGGTANAASGQTLGWNAVPAATGYAATMMGGGKSTSGEDSTTMVFWSSSDVQTFISGITDYLAPAEVARLIGKKMVMPPSQTQCAIPVEALKAVDGGIVSLVAHGPEVNHVSPPRPVDPKLPWVQDWVSRTRYRSTAGAMLADGELMTSMGGMGGGSRAAAATGAVPNPNCPPPAGANPAEAAGGALAGSLGSAMGSMFGSKKKKLDPNCPQ